MNRQRTMSPIDDPAPYEAPIPEPTVERKKNDYEKLATDDKKYPLIEKYFKERREFYQRYLPDGSSIISLTEKERSAAWVNAVIIIGELDAIEARIQGEIQL